MIRLISDALPNTLLLSGSAFLFAVALALPLGVLAAARHYSWFDNAMTLLSFLGASVPSFWLGLLVTRVLNSATNIVSSLGPCYG